MNRLYLLYQRFLFLPFWLVICFVAFSACNSSSQNEQSKNSADAISFPHKVEAKYAKGFRISYHDNYKLLEILKPFQDKVDTLRYSLVPRKIQDQVKIENTREIAIPVRKVIATSTTHIALTEMLNANNVISGMVGADYVYNPSIKKQIENGDITSFPMGELNKEKVLAMNPDLVMISGGQSSQFDNYQVLEDSGINLLVNSEWLETTPLGKAEWVKVMAALTNREQVANTKFSEVAKKYNELKSAVDSVDEKPLIFNNMPHKGAWFVSGGESFTAQFLKDAGANYPWYESNKTGGLRKGFEAVYEVGLRADIWLNPGAAKSKEDIIAKDSRFRDFKSFRTGKIYNNNKRINESGGNDFWESGVVHPEILLADLVSIFHPDILPNHTLYYYQRLD